MRNDKIGGKMSRSVKANSHFSVAVGTEKIQLHFTGTATKGKNLLVFKYGEEHTDEFAPDACKPIDVRCFALNPADPRKINSRSWRRSGNLHFVCVRVFVYSMYV